MIEYEWMFGIMRFVKNELWSLKNIKTWNAFRRAKKESNIDLGIFIVLLWMRSLNSYERHPTHKISHEFNETIKYVMDQANIAGTHKGD